MGFPLFVIIYTLLSMDMVACRHKVPDKADESSKQRRVDKEPWVPGKRRSLALLLDRF
jgi:hypothetical protein